GRLHARGLKQRDDVQLCVCRGRNPARAEAFAREFDARLYPSYEDMLAASALHAVDICVPNDLHREYALKAALAPKHILCEKPIALSLEDAAAMVEAARSAGVLLLIAHPLRFWPEYVRMRDILRSGELGRCFTI